MPKWFLYTIALAAAGFATVGNSIGIVNEFKSSFSILIMITAGLYTLAVKHGVTTKTFLSSHHCF